MKKGRRDGRWLAEDPSTQGGIRTTDVAEGTRAIEMKLRQAEALLGEDVVIGRAMTWRASTYLCHISGRRDPAEYWAYAVWDDAKRDWIEPTLLFRRLSDLVAHYQSKARRNVALPETSRNPVHPR